MMLSHEAKMDDSSKIFVSMDEDRKYIESSAKCPCLRHILVGMQMVVNETEGCFISDQALAINQELHKLRGEIGL